MIEQTRSAIAHAISQLLKVRISEIDGDTEFGEYGFDSVTLTELANLLGREFAIELTPTIFFEYATTNRMADHLVEDHRSALAAKWESPAPVEPSAAPMPSPSRRRFQSRKPITGSEPSAKTGGIAIIGMSGSFPMASNIDEFWQNICEGRDCISEIPESRWNWTEFYGDPAIEENRTDIKWGGVIEEIADFDPEFFGMTRSEAAWLDPAQRLLLIHSWKAIEDAGYPPGSLSGTRTGVYVGTSGSGYVESRIGDDAWKFNSRKTLRPSAGPNRVSKLFGFRGPSESIETACSSSLIALHRAVVSIASGECDMALVGGVNVLVNPELQVGFTRAGMLSQDGRCKTFSDRADGYVRGEGVGALLLKNIADAEKDGDHIYGVIRGSAENHGGRANSLTAPNPNAQTDVIRTAYARAGIDPATIGYIEAHGTGTQLGDPIEFSALRAVFESVPHAAVRAAEIPAHCGLGSVKSNIGHLELAAGIAGVIKVLLQLKYKTLARTLHCEVVNPYIKLDGSPFFIVRDSMEWVALRDGEGRELPRRAGVSSFGFGGSNAHVVIEEHVGGDGSARRKSLPPRAFANVRCWIERQPRKRLKTEAAVVTGVKQDAVGDKIENALLRRLAVVTGINVNDLRIDGDIRDYGIDSIQTLEFVKWITREFPNLDSRAHGNALLSCHTLKGFADQISGAHSLPRSIPVRTEAPAVSVLGDYDGIDLDPLVAAGKRDLRNVACQGVKIAFTNPLTVIGRVRVDETNPFFFDHPLDHVSGIHLAESLNQAVKAAYVHGGNLPPFGDVFVSHMDITFVSLCNKVDEALLRLTVEACDEKEWKWGAEIGQAGLVVARGVLVIRKSDAVHEEGLQKQATLAAASKRDVNKQREENVAVSVIALDGKSCRLLPKNDGHFAADFPGDQVDMIILLEASRQCMRLFAGAISAQPDAAGAEPAAPGIPFLKSISVSLDSPAFWNDAIEFRMDQHELSEIGSNAMVKQSGKILVNELEQGQFDALGVMLSPDYISARK